MIFSNKKTIIFQRPCVYSSFPTFAAYEGSLYFFYRQGISGNSRCHGIDGKVKCFTINKEVFLDTFDTGGTDFLWNYGKDFVVFSEGNEFDAIISKFDENHYSLATRSYDHRNIMRTFLSLSSTPYFESRNEIKIKELQWFAFYGKGFKHKRGYIFPAYGYLKGESIDRPLLIITEDFSRYDLLSYLPSNIGGSILNECSVVYSEGLYSMFMRDDTYPFGIWYSTSEDLEHWKAPKKIHSWAHAPMALIHHNKIVLSYREFLSSEKTAISISTPFAGDSLIVDSFEGNPYDGGYSDMGIIDGRLFICYYIGNIQGEPFIKCCEVNGSFP